MRQNPNQQTTSERDALGQVTRLPAGDHPAQNRGPDGSSWGSRSRPRTSPWRAFCTTSRWLRRPGSRSTSSASPSATSGGASTGRPTPDYEFRTALTMEPEWLRRRYRDACERARQAAASADSLDQLSVSTRIDGPPCTLRWVLLHLIEETARHAGQADLLREAIDGTVGDNSGHLRRWH